VGGSKRPSIFDEDRIGYQQKGQARCGAEMDQLAGEWVRPGQMFGQTRRPKPHLQREMFPKVIGPRNLRVGNLLRSASFDNPATA
jgi:hypothetical protein